MRNLHARLLLILVIIIQISPNFLETSATPVRKVTIYTPYPSIQITEGKDVNLDVFIENVGEVNETLDLKVESPKGWEADIFRRGYVIKSIYLASNESLNLDFITTPSDEVTSGNYTFIIKILSRDKKVEASLPIEISLLSKTIDKIGISLSAEHPTMEGAADMDYEFSVTVENMIDENRVIEFSALKPDDWIVIFKPPYEEKQIRSMAFDPLDSSVIWVTISPPSNVNSGSHSITIQAESGETRGTLVLNVIITGTYQLELNTPGGLLSFDAMQGEETKLPLIINNMGTGFLEDLRFSSSRPTGWDIQFEPIILPLIEPGDSWEINVIVKPPSDAIPGDYQVILHSFGSPYETSDSLDLRVTVRGSQRWGFLGVGIIAGIVVMLIVIVWRFGRR